MKLADDRSRQVAAADEASERVVRVTAFSRLHFGLSAWGGTGRQFGGVGLMVARPAIELFAERAERFEACGVHAERLPEFARRWRQSVEGVLSSWAVDPEAPRELCGSSEPVGLPAVRLTVRAAPDQHVGLGVGTQLGLSVAAALNRLSGLSVPDAAGLARSVGRGGRSSIGTYGFLHGGLMYEPGKLPGEVLAPEFERFEFPAEWRIVLMRPDEPPGTAGEAERRAFAALPPVPAERTEELLQIVRRGLAPAVLRGDFEQFSEAIYDYGRLAGDCFAAVQGGPFNGGRLTELVRQTRALGVRGVGQSSWGPTLFALLQGDEAAADFLEHLERTEVGRGLTTVVTRAVNHGAVIDAE